MNPKWIWPFAAALVTVGSFPGCAARPLPETRLRKPNVLLVALDDIALRLGSYEPGVKTPHLDRLAGRGRRFDHAYRQYPLRVPARVSLLLGRRPETTRIWGDLEPGDPWPGSAPLPDQFRSQGYFTARVGRFLGPPGDEALHFDLAEEASPDEAAARTVRIMEEKKDGPFLLIVGFNRPRPGWVPPPKYFELYNAQQLPLPPEPTVDWDGIPPLALADAGVAPPSRSAPPPLPEDQRRRALAAELAYLSYLDAQAGALLEALERLKLKESTVVAVVGDDPPWPGPPLPRPDLLLEDALKVSLIVAAPGLRQPGAASGQVVELIDLYPTFLDLAGLPAPPGIEGASLLPALRDPGRAVKSSARSSVRREAGPLGRSVRTDRYRYTEWPDGSRELYDHRADPHEYTNLAQSPAHAAALRDAKALLDAGPRAAALPAPPGPAPALSAPLNVLLIIVDDLNVRLGCYGYDVKSPNIDRLAHVGRAFHHAYCQVPSCSPSRTSLMTGWRPERTGVWDNLQIPRDKLPGAVPLQEHFQAQGYFTARVGKIYHGPFEDEFRWALAEHTPYLPGDEANEPPPRKERLLAGGSSLAWTATDNKDEDEPDGRTARRVAGLIEAHRGKPFFIAAGFNKPHIHWVAPRRYFDLYPPGRILLPPEPSDDWKDIPEIAIARHPPRWPGAFLTGPVEAPDDDLRRRATAAYYACVSFADAQVGVLLEALDRLKLWEQTVVVLLSDHGFHLGEHTGLWRKNTLFEESLRVPLIIAAPSVREPGSPSEQLVESVDLYPTLVELAGLPRVEGLEGVSLLPLLQDPRPPVKRAAFSLVPRQPPELGRSLRTRRWRYTQWPDGSEELYDLWGQGGAWRSFLARLLGRNPLRNLAGDPDHAATLEKLRKRLEGGP